MSETLALRDLQRETGEAIETAIIELSIGHGSNAFEALVEARNLLDASQLLTERLLEERTMFIDFVDGLLEVTEGRST